MNPTTQKLTNWAIGKIKADYPDDVALLVAVTGHSVNGDGHGECFDYFVPATERGNELSQTFIVGGVGHDLYPRSWERTERTANLDDRATQCLGNAKILYSRCKEDEDRFLALREKLFENLNNPQFVYKKALERLNVAMDLYRTMMFEDRLYRVHLAAGYIADYLMQAVMYLNGTFQSDWRDGSLPELRRLAALPDHFIEYNQAVIRSKSIDELRNLAHLLIRATRRFIAERRPEGTDAASSANFANLADWYQEMSLTWRRLRYYCQIHHSDAAFTDACYLQNELCIVGEEFGLKEMDMLGSFDADDLAPLAARAAELEAYVTSEIEAHGAVIRRYATVDDFLNQA